MWALEIRWVLRATVSRGRPPTEINLEFSTYSLLRVQDIEHAKIRYLTTPSRPATTGSNCCAKTPFTECTYPCTGAKCSAKPRFGASGSPGCGVMDAARAPQIIQFSPAFAAKKACHARREHAGATGSPPRAVPGCGYRTRGVIQDSHVMVITCRGHPPVARAAESRSRERSHRTWLRGDGHRPAFRVGRAATSYHPGSQETNNAANVCPRTRRSTI